MHLGNFIAHKRFRGFNASVSTEICDPQKSGTYKNLGICVPSACFSNSCIVCVTIFSLMVNLLEQIKSPDKSLNKFGICTHLLGKSKFVFLSLEN